MIEVYTLPKCKNCNKAREYFNSKDIEYVEIDMSIGGNKEVQARKKQFKGLGLREYPIIIIKSEKGGELYTSFDEDIIEKMLKE